MFKSLGYSIKQSFIQIFRNRGMSIASIFSITAMLLILGLFCMLTVNVNLLTETIKDQFDTIEVFLLDETNESETEKMKASLEAMEEVAGVTFISKDEAMEDFRERFGENAYLLDGLTENPLPNSLRVQLRSLNDGDFVAEICRNLIGVEDVRYYQTEVNKILKLADVIQKGALVIIAFLVIVSVVVVSNTVKLTVFARQDEIIIMKYVGATNWFVRGPMLVEGMMIGLISAIIALGVAGFVYYKIVQSMGSQVMLLMSTELVEPMFMIENLAWIFAALGASIGSIGSIISMRRFLKA